MISRLNLARLGGLAALISGLLSSEATIAASLADQVAIQTWTLRNLNFEQVVDFAQRHGIKDLQLIPNHLDYKKESKEQLAAKKARLEAAGLRAYTYGVAGTSLDKEENRKLFEFAKFMGMKLIIVEPGDFRIWDNLEELAKEYDIKVAVHNHGIKSLYGNPAIVRQVVLNRDPRLGVCMDVGWVTSGNFDAAQVYKDYKGRVFDIHLKDKKVQKTAKGDDVANDTHVGEGDANYKGLFKALRESGYTGRLAIETDSQDFARQPDDFVRKAKEFVVGNDASESR
jgi:sugar phosphate isomerase/epimerase